MAYQGQIVDIFVSSPGDVSKYRDRIISIVQAWNQRNGRNRRLFFNCLRWEDMVAPDIGETGQDVITSQVGDGYDIFLGVMWSRFGSPTKVAESGTEEEFDRAILRHRSGEPIKVSFLFCTADVPFSQLDGEQFAKMQVFKLKAQNEGCLTRDFVDDASLINSVNLILDRFANTWKGSQEGAEKNGGLGEDEGRSGSGNDQREFSDQDEDGPDDRGLLDVYDDFEIHNQEFVRIIGEWGDRLEGIANETEIVADKLSDLTKFGNTSPQPVREVLVGFTAVMDAFGMWCEDQISELETLMTLMSQDALMLVDLSREVDESVEDIVGARDALISLCESIDGANGGIASFVQSIESSPKLDKKLNKANRRVINTHRQLMEKNRIFQEDVALCVGELSERIGH